MDSLKVAPWAPEPAKQPISYYITRMNEQRGSFLDLTEQELEDEIAHGVGSQTADAVSEDEDEDPVAKRREELRDAKEQIVLGIDRAHYEVAQSRDFVSLLLTGDKGKPNAHITLAEMIKNRVPMGSLGMAFVRPALPNAQDKEKVAASTVHERRLAAGLKLRALNSSADSVLAAAQRLQEEMTREARYWEDLVSIKEKGWLISRSSRDRRELGVRLSALESAPEYRGKGFVKIGRTDEGKAELDLSDDLGEGKRLRVEIRSHGRVLAATNNDADSSSSADGAPLHESLKRARDSLFDEELFHELSRESAALWNMGIKWTDQGVVIPFDGSTDITVSLVAPGDIIDVTMLEGDSSSELYQQVANSLAPVFRILLSYGFRQIYNKRSAPPQPLTSRKPARTVHSILQPLLHRTKHQVVQRHMNEFLDAMVGVLKRAGFDAHLDRARDDMGLRAVLDSLKLSGPPAVEAIVYKLSNPTASHYILRLEESKTTIKIMFRITAVGAEFRYEMSNVPHESQLFKVPHEMISSDQSEFQDTVSHMVQVQLTELIYSRLDRTKWILDSPHTGEMRTKTPDIARGGRAAVQLLKVGLLKGSLNVTLKRPTTNGASSERSWSVLAKDETDTDIISELLKADEDVSAQGR